MYTCFLHLSRMLLNDRRPLDWKPVSAKGARNTSTYPLRPNQLKKKAAEAAARGDTAAATEFLSRLPIQNPALPSTEASVPTDSKADIASSRLSPQDPAVTAQDFSAPIAPVTSIPPTVLGHSAVSVLFQNPPSSSAPSTWASSETALQTQ